MKKILIAIVAITALASCQKRQCQSTFLETSGNYHTEMSNIILQYGMIPEAEWRQDQINCTENYLSQLKVLRATKGCDRVNINGSTIETEYYKASVKLNKMYLGIFN